MPSGVVHYRNWKIGWLGSIPISATIALQVNPVIAVGSLIGYGMGALLDPDMDQMAITGSESRMVKIPVLGWILYGISSVYGAIFRKHHRSFFTHFPVISTIIRLIFCFWWVPLLFYLHILTLNAIDVQVTIGITFGLSFSDTLHFLADVLSPHHKRGRYGN